MEEKPLPLSLSPDLFLSSFDPIHYASFLFFFFVFHYYDIVFTFSLLKPITSKMVGTWPKQIKAQFEINITFKIKRQNTHT